MTRKQPPIARPTPPAHLTDVDAVFGGLRFAPAPEVGEWVERTILDPQGQLTNPDHAHLQGADIAYLWASTGFRQKQRGVVGTAEEVVFRCNGWQRGRQEQQMVEWFGGVPRFLITLSARYALECDDADWCALVEHELYHVAHQRDFADQPMFGKDGMPKLCIKGHDVEEFVGVVRRYGVGHPDGLLSGLVRAASSGPEISRARVAQACGTCMLRAA